MSLAEANGVDDGVGFIENAALLTTIGVTCTKLVSSSCNVRKKKRKTVVIIKVKINVVAIRLVTVKKIFVVMF